MAGQGGNTLEHARAVELALSGSWDDAHRIVQGLGTDPLACWIHAVLHKIEGDDENARYWYARTDHGFEDFSDNTLELEAIQKVMADTPARET